jgi:hypothetical protein
MEMIKGIVAVVHNKVKKIIQDILLFFLIIFIFLFDKSINKDSE